MSTTTAVTATGQAQADLEAAQADLTAAKRDLGRAEEDRATTITRLSGGDSTISALDLSALDAGVRRAELLASAAETRLTAAADQHRAAALEALMAEAGAAMDAHPLAAVQDAFTAARQAVADANAARAAYIQAAHSWSSRLQQAGAPLVAGTDTGDGWVGSVEPTTREGVQLGGHRMTVGDVPSPLAFE